jgi:signal transduction histidine kinase
MSFLSTGTHLRDYLLDPDPAGSEASLRELKALRAELNGILSDYEKVISSEDRPTYERFQRNLERYWQVIDPVLGWDHARRKAEGFAYLKQVVFPKRAELLALAADLGSLNERHLQSISERYLETFGLFRSRLTGALFATLGLGIVLGLMTSLYILRLEHDLGRQYQEIERARAQLEELSARIVEAQEQERRNIARELHDEVGQSLSALLVDLGNATAVAPAGAEDLRGRLGSVRKLAETSLQTVRDLALLLRPSMLDDFGLVPALHWQAREFLRRYGVQVTVQAGELEDDLPESVRTCIYRVVQEALANVARHAEASSAKVLLRKDEGRILVVVQDDGRGFDTATSKGLGLLGMEERARRLNGTFRVESAPGKGTVAQLVLPLPESTEAGAGGNEAVGRIPE